MRRAHLTIALLLALAAAPAGAQIDLRDPFDVRMQAGAEAYAGKDYEAAARHFGDARLIRPDSPEAAMNQGLALARQGEFDQALQRLGDAQSLAKGRPGFEALPRFNEGVANLRRAESLLEAAEKDPKQASKQSRAETVDSLIGAIDAFAGVQGSNELAAAARDGRALAQAKLGEMMRPQPTPPPDQQQSGDDNKDPEKQDQDQQQNQQQNQQQQDQQQSDQQQQQSDQQSSSSQQQQDQQSQQDADQKQDGEKSDQQSKNPKPTPTPSSGMEAQGTPDFNKPSPTPTPAPSPKPGDQQQPGDDPKDQQQPQDGDDQQQGSAQGAQAQEGDGDGEPAQMVMTPADAERLLNMIDDRMLMFRQGQQSPPRSGKDW